ncbi:hypothetical protein SAMN04489752_0654 [Brevibacterium siliguriense]|uniref:Uncharacterized protein n=1 Tax=Brevibacterium siliguriense TaxID=1136497 RepID=A0A1H1N7E9_9MICO|nr:hypothetical protein [Brevibacterium siliguriense]SDR95041.1 hypothetical protein SAMN04489752_0654 [Brevibacterium siliguriense]
MSETPPGPPPPGPLPLHEEEPVPTWTRDFLRVLGLNFVGALFFTFLIWFASTGLMLQQNFEVIEANAVWMGICAGILAFFFPFLFMKHKRPDDGFRREGLIPLALLNVLASAAIGSLVALVWPFFLGERAVPGTVAAELNADPASFFLVLLFFIGGMAWSMCLMMPMMIGGYKVALWLLLPYLGFVFLIGFAGVRVFDNPPSLLTTLFWVAIALTGLAALTVLAALRNVIDKPKARMTAAERDVAYQGYLADRRRRGLTNENPLPGIDGPQQPPWQPPRQGPSYPSRQPPSPPQTPHGPQR